MGLLHQVELNFFYLHYQDALKLTEWAEKETTRVRSLYARKALTSVVFAAEALINRVASDFITPQSWFDSIDKLGLTEKWHLIPLICRDAKDNSQTFDRSSEPFQSFHELVKIRNWFVHPKTSQFIDAWVDPNSTVSLSPDKTIPWVETIKGEKWPQTQIPKNPFELDGSDARKAIKIFDAMVMELKTYLKGRVTDDWLAELEVKDRGKQLSYKMPVRGLWGGYTPSNSADE